MAAVASALRCPSRGAVLAVAFLLACPAMATASENCGVPLGTGPGPKANDCLFILRVGVELEECRPCVCDVNDSGNVSASDALGCLEAAVGGSGALSCPPCPDTTTTTTLAAGGCPDVVEWITHAGVGALCQTNADCEAGTCDDAGGRCRTPSELEIGWKGFGHGIDLNDGWTARLRVQCEGEGPVCGECAVAGVDPSDGNCRCANDLGKVCDDPFEVDADDCLSCSGGVRDGGSCSTNEDCSSESCALRCSDDRSILCDDHSDCAGLCGPGTRCLGGDACSSNADCVCDDLEACAATCTAAATCNCYEGTPLPISAAGTPFCVLPLLAADLSGTVDLDSGSSSVTRQLLLRTHHGVTTDAPCPVCGGRCADDDSRLCVFDSDCDSQDCVVDELPRDGVRGGYCSAGAREGRSCDVHATNTGFPLREAVTGGAGYSLDCPPDTGSNISGMGLRVVQAESTGRTELASNLPCSSLASELSCPCLVCSGDGTVPCSSDAQCENQQGSTCSATGTGGSASLPNECDDGLCSDIGGGEGECTNGPDDRFCDHWLRADGSGSQPCGTNDDCVSTDTDEQPTCTLVQRRPCFLEPIVAEGAADPYRPVTAATFCLGTTMVTGRNSALSLPGPARLRRQTSVRAFCAADPERVYIPGVGGCVP